ncbi:hypothetical protein GPAL_1750 [Glaciecola pallidula DSM 14239 = ACAM 615]|uniref:Uncharacterized protein n=1 Tax=Brumicola pallidula DSM 14239 = ACAM 615 TaxID=1121922 RepID=K6ZI93_9ALTE|nr:hypothetical protein GPAL_1750 [Glaciecola pallidula DSM 14239 = ACAM 615]
MVKSLTEFQVNIDALLAVFSFRIFQPNVRKAKCSLQTKHFACK